MPMITKGMPKERSLVLHRSFKTFDFFIKNNKARIKICLTLS